MEPIAAVGENRGNVLICGTMKKDDNLRCLRTFMRNHSALDTLRAIRETNPENALLQRRLATVLIECGQFADAQSELQNVSRATIGARLSSAKNDTMNSRQSALKNAVAVYLPKGGTG